MQFFWHTGYKHFTRIVSNIKNGLLCILQEAREIAEMLGVQAMTGPDASKEAVLKTICQAECIHIAAAVSWKLSAVVLSPGEVHDEEEEKPVTSRYLLVLSDYYF